MSGENRFKIAVGILRDVLPDSSVTIHRDGERTDNRTDLTLETADRRLVIAIKATQSTRLSDLEGRLASASLRAIRIADENATPTVMIELPRLGPRASSFAEEFMAKNAPHVGWCLFDANGAYRLEFPALGFSRFKPACFGRKSRSPRARESFFSDLNRWMLKILLMRKVRSDLWGGPKQSITSAKELRTVAKVSTEKAYSFLRAFESAGYVRESADGLIVTRREELMRMWLNHELAFRSESVPVRSIFGPVGDLTEVLRRDNGPSTFALTGFEACRRLDVLHAPVPRREVCMHGSIDAAIEAWELQRCEPRDADLVISKMANPKSIVRGCVIVGGRPTVDVLEAAIAVSGQLPRGAEQARHIFTDVLSWEDCL